MKCYDHTLELSAGYVLIVADKLICTDKCVLSFEFLYTMEQFA